MVTGIKDCEESDVLIITTNAGLRVFPEIARLKFFSISVYFDENSMATILSLKDIANIPGMRITMDTSVEKAINVKFKSAVFKFVECSDSLYYYDVVDAKNTKSAVIGVRSGSVTCTPLKQYEVTHRDP